MDLVSHTDVGRPSWLSSERARWWLASIGLVPLFIAGGAFAMGALGIAIGATDADGKAWGFALIALFGVLSVTPALATLTAGYLLALRFSLRDEGDARVRARALALSPILLVPWVIGAVLDPGEPRDLSMTLPILLGGSLLYAWVVPPPGAAREARVRALRRTGMGVLALAAAYYLILAFAAAF